MNGILRQTSTIFVTLTTLAVLVACGGGGGSAGGVPVFSGVSTQAVIDDENAQQLVMAAYDGGALTDSLIMPLSVGGGRNLPLAPLGKILFDSLPSLDFTPRVAKLATQTNTVAGPCGGSATMTISDQGTSASGSVVYGDYCDGGVILNGSMTFSGTLNTQTNVVSISMGFNNLSVGAGSLYGSVSMSVDLDDPNAPSTMSMSVLLTDSLDRTYWVQNYTISVTPGGTLDAVQFSGTYHDFDAGHVVITTTETLQVDSFSGIPESGTLHFAGANGTYADLTATGGGTYTLTVSNTGTVINGTF